MEPLESSPMPTRAALIGITINNSWPTGDPQKPVRCAYVATNSTQRIAFVSLQNTKNPERVVRIVTRNSHFHDMPYGIVVELHLTQELAAGETVYVSVAQAGATSYYPPQPIDDVPSAAQATLRS
jgi:hypothetical protein